MQRLILHSDMNSFYASVEEMLNPQLKSVPMAVGGSVAQRHGIILAKNLLAKKHGVSTGEALWEAQEKCEGLVIVPPHMEKYIQMSKRARDIYERFTPTIEPFGLDECWLDVTHLKEDGEVIARRISAAIKSEMGMTVSIGVSYNKIFAKFGSDYKKPDAITVITEDNYKDIVWPAPVEDLFFVGRATKRKLEARNVKTIGDLARYERKILVSWFGKNGGMIWDFACGFDRSAVAPCEYVPPIKSVGRGTTCVADLLNEDEVKQVIYDRTLQVSRSLRANGLMAQGVQISVRNNELWTKEYQCRLPYPTQAWHDIAEQAFALFREQYQWSRPIRSITVRAINLLQEGRPEQLSLFWDHQKREKTEVLEKTMEGIKDRYGKHAIIPAIIMQSKVPHNSPGELMQMPSVMHR